MRVALVLIGALAVLGLIVHCLRCGGRLPSRRVRSVRMRLHLRQRPGPGFASGFELWWRWGRLASFRQSRRSRPGLGFWRRALHPAEHGVFCGRAQRRHGLRLAIQEHLLVLGPPRLFKSGFLARVIMTYPGPVVAASTKPDLFSLTSGLRWRRGRYPVHVFNPQRIPGVLSTLRWDPVCGCQDEAVAWRRAQAFCEAARPKGTNNDEFWSDQATTLLRALFCAAALGGHDLRMVNYWVLSGETQPAERILTDHGRLTWAAVVAKVRLSRAEKTTDTIRLVLIAALSFMGEPATAECVLPADGEGFDIRAFLRQRGTLYLIGEQRGESCPISALFAALVAEIHWEAIQLGGAQRGSRLDPPLGLVLDEVTQIVPVPLPSILADSGGRGIQILAGCHGVAQLKARWGEHGARSVLDTANLLLVPGVSDPDTLEMVSRLCGEASYAEDGKRVRCPAAPPEVVNQLPPRFGVLKRTFNAPVLPRLPAGWRYWRYLLARLAGTDVAPLVAVASGASETFVPLAGLTELAALEDELSQPGPPAPPAAAANGHSANGHAGNGHSGADGRTWPAPWDPR
jgi:type IV secretion system protein VirD4